MRISLVMTSGGAGGLQQSIIPYASALKLAGHQIQLLMFSGSPLLDDVRAHGFAPDLISSGLWPGSFVRNARKKLAEFQPEAIIGFASRGYPIARKAAPSGVPVFSRVGTMNQRRLRKLLSADGLIVTSKLGAKPAKVGIVPNFLAAGLKAEATTEGRVPVVGSLGRFVHRKGFDLLLEAAGKLQRQGEAFELVLAGNGPEEVRLKRQAQELGLAVRWPGWIGNHEKPDFFASIDIFVNPARDEPFGFVFLEAMSARVAVVAADTVGARAIFVNGVDGLIASHDDADSLAMMIGGLIRDRVKRMTLAEAGERKYYNQFDCATASGALDNLLKTWLISFQS